MSSPIIIDVKTIHTAPANSNLTIVKVQTDEPELYGLGCATFTQRYQAVQTAIDSYIKPFVIGKDPHRIEDIWQTAMVSGYWRNGPVLNNALSGLDMALWDIKGKIAGLPVYQLLGGKCREVAAVYCHIAGRDGKEAVERVRCAMEEGYRHIRVQLGTYGGLPPASAAPLGALTGCYFDPKTYVHQVTTMFEKLRADLGFDVQLLHDVHERLAPIDGVQLAKSLEPHRLFFLEDLFAPEDWEWFRTVRRQCATPLAMGELWNNPSEWNTLIVERLIDYIRVHISQIGGVTPARKLATFCESFGIKTAWHGPGDVSPVGHAANLHLDLASINFGIQELGPGVFEDDRIREVFPSDCEVKRGYLYPDEKPGFGVALDESKAKKYPPDPSLPTWTLARTVDGTPARP